MDELQNMVTTLRNLEKDTSIRKIASASGISYLTLLNIRAGKSKRVTESVAKRFNSWLEKQGTASTKNAAAPIAAKKRGRPAKVAAAPPAKTAAPAKAAPVAAKKRGRPAKQGVAVAAPQRGKKAAAPAVKTKGAKAKRGGKQAMPDVLPSFDMTAPLLGGDAVHREIAMLEARLEYLRLIQKAEADFLRKIGR